MISFWVDAEGAFGIENYLSARGAPIRERFDVRRYEWRDTTEVQPGQHIFAAIDRLESAERGCVAELFDQLTRLQPGLPPLNDPRRCLLRPALLQALAEEGINQFRAYPAEASRRIERFPVFMRPVYEHHGSLTPLLGTAAELRRALVALALRGYEPRELLIVEFCDTSDANGIFRKYSAFRVGEVIVPWHVMASREWVVKGDTAEHTLELVRAELDYLERNPHADWLRRVFTLAGIDYGRIDFGVLGGRPQVWEINLNPTIGRNPAAAPRKMEPQVAELRQRSRLLANDGLVAAFAALDRPGASESLTLHLDQTLRGQVAREAAARQQRHRVSGSLRNALRHSRVGTLMRSVLDRLFPLRRQ